MERSYDGFILEPYGPGAPGSRPKANETRRCAGDAFPALCCRGATRHGYVWGDFCEISKVGLLA